jgi:membrane fusion protein, heavy metal efflux system
MKIMLQKYTLAAALVSFLALSVAYTAPVWAMDDHAEAGHADEENGGHADAHGDEEENKLTIDPQVAADMNIEVAAAGAAVVSIAVPVTGRVVLNKNAIAEVHGRFEGIVKSVTKTEGEMVKTGDTLATVESNESLQVYAVKSPLSGIVLERETNVGHIAGADAMFKIADLSKLWAEFNVFAKDISKVAIGQKIRIKVVGGDLAAETTIISLLPLADSTSQTVIVRAEIDNTNGPWRAGLSLQGEIFTAEKSVPVAIKTTAIQRMEGNTVVFVEEEGAYEPRPVKLGLQDGIHAEVLEGLKAGEKYVSANSFLLKAHAGKAGAEHAH